MDVKINFLHSDLEEKIYMVQLEGFSKPGYEYLVCKLRNYFMNWNNLQGNDTNDLTPTWSGSATKDMRMTVVFM
jgi:hypothetical protein